MDKKIKGIDQEILLIKIFDAIDRGVTIDELRRDPIKYILSGETKKIVLNIGGEGLKVSYEILKEMEKRGDPLAKKLIEEDNFEEINRYDKEYINDPNHNKWCYLETSYKNYDRENKILIEILEEGKIKNIGGWTLHVYDVPIEKWAYKICKAEDMFGSEYIQG